MTAPTLEAIKVVILPDGRMDVENACWRRLKIDHLYRLKIDQGK